MYCDLQAAPNGKIDKFLKSVEAGINTEQTHLLLKFYCLIIFTFNNNLGGVILQEPSRFKKAQPWDADRPEKPWEVTE